MSEDVLFFVRCVWYLLPMGCANLAPVVFRNQFRPLAIPVDRFFGRRGFFGSHKTLRGLIVAVLFGTVVFWLQQELVVVPWLAALGFFDYREMSIWFGTLAGLGAILGDLFRSAIKRRVGIRPGGRFLPFDQLDYVSGGMVFSLALFRPTWAIVFGVLFVGFFLHAGSSGLAYALGMKRDRW